VPSVAATTALPEAMRRLFRKGSVIVGSRRASPNHFVENPSQFSTWRPPLKAKTTTTAIGAYRKT
jgi:hypothetical protein